MRNSFKALGAQLISPTRTNVRSGKCLFRYVEHEDEETHTREWSYNQDLEPQQPPAPLTDADGFWNVQPSPQPLVAPFPQPLVRPPAQNTPAGVAETPPRSNSAQAESLQHEGQAAASTGADEAGVKEEEHESPNEKRKRGAASKVAGSAKKNKTGGQTTDPKTEADQKSMMRAAEAQMKQLISNVAATTLQATEIQASVKNNSGWKWLSSTPQYGKFLAEIEKLEEQKIKQPIVRALMMSMNELGHRSLWFQKGAATVRPIKPATV